MSRDFVQEVYGKRFSGVNPTIAVGECLVDIWYLQKYVNWLCVFSKVNPFFQKAQVFCMDLQPAADPYNVVCTGGLWATGLAVFFN